MELNKEELKSFTKCISSVIGYPHNDVSEVYNSMPDDIKKGGKKWGMDDHIWKSIAIEWLKNNREKVLSIINKPNQSNMETKQEETNTEVNSETNKNIIEDVQEFCVEWEKRNNLSYPLEMHWTRLEVNKMLNDYKLQFA
jgi:hypothetical protein